MKARRLISLMTAWSFLVALLTGIVLFMVPAGRVAYWSDWSFIGLSKTEWGNLHVTSCALFSVSGVWHLLLNIKPILAYFKRKCDNAVRPSWELLLSLLVTALLCVGTYQQWPPFSTLVALGQKVKDAGSDKYGEPPYGHAELSSLQTLATRLQFDLRKAVQTLKKNGITFDGPGANLKEIAARNGTTPGALYDMMLRDQPSSSTTAAGALPLAPPPGLGRKTVEQIAEMYGVSGQTLLSALEAEGVVVSPDTALKDLAAKAGKNPATLYELMQRASAE